MYFYQRLKDMREDLDKKQEDIALILNITRQQYQLYESGKREMPMHHFLVFLDKNSNNASYFLFFTWNKEFFII